VKYFSRFTSSSIWSICRLFSSLACSLFRSTMKCCRGSGGPHKQNYFFDGQANEPNAAYRRGLVALTTLDRTIFKEFVITRRNMVRITSAESVESDGNLQMQSDCFDAFPRQPKAIFQETTDGYRPQYVWTLTCDPVVSLIQDFSCKTTPELVAATPSRRRRFINVCLHLIRSGFAFRFRIVE